MTPRYLVVLAVALLSFATPAWATTYYVDKIAGSDGNNCTQAQTPATAKATIAGGYSCWTDGQSDDVQVIGNGVAYTESLLTIAKSGAGTGTYASIGGRLNPNGTYDMPIWCLTGHAPSVDVQSEPVWSISSKNWIRIHHFEFCEDVSITMAGNPGATNILVERNAFDGRPGLSYSAGGNNPSVVEINCNSANHCTDITVRYNTIKGTQASTCTSQCNQLDFAHVFIDHADRVSVYGNDFKASSGGAWGNGVFLKHSGTFLSVRQNFFDNIPKSCLNVTEQDGDTTDISFYQNVCWGDLNNGGVQISGTNHAVVHSNYDVHSNTFYTPTTGGRCYIPNFPSGFAPTGFFKVYSNVCRLATGSTQRYVSQDGPAINAAPTWDYNHYSRATSGSDDGTRLFRASSGTCQGTGCNVATWRALSDTPDVHTAVGTDPNLSSVGGSSVANYKTTDTVGTASWTACSSDGTSSGGPCGAWLTSSDVVGLPPVTSVAPTGFRRRVKPLF